MHVYQMRSSVASVVAASQERISICMNALKDVSKVWLVAKMVHTLFESILGNKMLEERLQKATGRRAQKANKSAANASNTIMQQQSSNNTSTATKRKYDDLDLGFAPAAPAPQVSYERSRPQTPSVTPSRDLPQPMNNNTLSPPQAHRQTSDHYLPTNTQPQPHTGFSRVGSRSHSRIGTRASSPGFGYSMPTTPPDLFLVTRNSPPISQSLWENFQPDQLFPDGSLPSNIDGLPPLFTTNMSSHNANSMVDPQLQGLGGGQQNLGVPGSSNNTLMDGMWDMGPAGGDMSDGWSTSSRGQAPIVPTALNVEDWFQFFGINGDIGGAGALGLGVLGEG